MSWGSLGSGPGQFDTPHGIAVSPDDEIYVADRGNRRIQVFEPDGTYIREFTVDVPVDPSAGRVVFGNANPTGTRGSLAPGAPDALCMTPGPNPVLFIGDVYRAGSTRCRCRARCSACTGSPVATSASSVGFTESHARPRTRSGWPS